MTYILGINAYHADSSACLIHNGKIIAAVEEERFQRIKHWAGFPLHSITYCLKEANIALDDVEHIALNQDSKANLGKKLAYAVKARPELSMILDRVKNRQKRSSLADQFKRFFPQESFDGQYHAIEHHLAHLSSAFHVSPYKEAIIVSIDGFGDFASTAWAIGRDTDIHVKDKIYFPHSLGIFYQALTQYLGFPNYGDEYKVMGLAPYGEARYLEHMREIVKLHTNGGFSLNLKYFLHHKEKVAHEWQGGSPTIGTLYSSALNDLLGEPRLEQQSLEQRHKDIAYSIHAMYEEAFFHLLNSLHSRYQLDSLTLAGGCAMNSVANGKITQKTPFKNTYIQSAAGDAGGAIGAAYSVWHGLGGKRQQIMDHASWGGSYTDKEIQMILDEHIEALKKQGCTINHVENEKELCNSVAKDINNGKVIAWFQGRMEWGPRALGNRSILCDPRRADAKDILNDKIKRRESFRPFAPSILRESVKDWFEQDDDVPFMMKVFPVREDKRLQIPAVTHVDGSGRLQTVDEKTNPRYYHLIKAFETLSDVPILLNTSFNENEPIVNNPSEALDCFLRTKIDTLVLGNWLIRRKR